MKRFLVVAAVVPILLALVPAAALNRNLEVRTYKRDLNFPVDIAWERDTDRIFFTEKATGKIRVLEGKRLLHTACVRLSVNASGERGTLGIALDPQFDENHYLYVYYTNASPLENRVTRFKVVDNRCINPHHIIRGIPSPSTIHQGGQLEFVNGKLFVSVGDGGDPTNAQLLDNRLGKILRYNPDGSIPKGNPFSKEGDRNPVWSYGHRNPFGLTHEPGTTRLFETENGPACDDEVNRIKKGRNYGWGDGYRCGTAGVGPNPKSPLWRWTPTIAPTDAWWYDGSLRRLSGSLYVGDFNTRWLHRFKLNAKGTRVRSHRRIFHASRQITDVAEGPGNLLYFATMIAIKQIAPK